MQLQRAGTKKKKKKEGSNNSPLSPSHLTNAFQSNATSSGQTEGYAEIWTGQTLRNHASCGTLRRTPASREKIRHDDQQQYSPCFSSHNILTVEASILPPNHTA